MKNTPLIPVNIYTDDSFSYIQTKIKIRNFRVIENYSNE